jgi:hypothetical protein
MLRDFFWCGGVVFLQGFLRNRGVLTWFFDGEFVVEGVVKMVCSWSLFRRLKFSTFFNFIFGDGFGFRLDKLCDPLG